MSSSEYIVPNWTRIIEVDDNLCEPVFVELDIKNTDPHGAKFRWDETGYYVPWKGRELYINFRDDSDTDPVYVEIYEVFPPYRGWGEYGGKEAVGIVKVLLPRKRWKGLQRKLREIFTSL